MELKEKSVKELGSLSTFDLAFKLAIGEFDEAEKFEVLKIIRSRELKNEEVNQMENENSTDDNNVAKKKPLKGSKTEKIYNLLNEGKRAKDVYDILTKQNITVYYPEIYRVGKKYFPELFT